MARLADLIKQQGINAGIEAQKLGPGGQNNTPIYVSVVNRNNQVIVRTSDPDVLEEITKLKEQIDVPTPQVLLEIKILSVDLSDGFQSVFDYRFGDGHQIGGFSTGPIQNVRSTLTPGGNGESAPFALNPNSLIYQWVSDNFAVRMQLLESKNRVTTLATPMLLVANNEVSRVFIGQERPIVDAVSSQTTATQGVVTTAPQTTFEFKPVGTTLLVTPNINSDRTVTLRLIQETSSVITGGASIPIINGNGSVTNQPVDVVSAQTLTGTLVAKDGLSLALGGLIEEGVEDTREEVPILGKLPAVGVLFRRQSTNRFRRESIIVIRPFILTTPSEAVAASKHLEESNSINPMSRRVNPPAGEAIGGLKTYSPYEVPRPNVPRDELQRVFHFHETLPDRM